MKAPLLNVCIINIFTGWRTRALHAIIAGCQHYRAECVDQKEQATHPVLWSRTFTMVEYGGEKALVLGFFEYAMEAAIMVRSTFKNKTMVAAVAQMRTPMTHSCWFSWSRFTFCSTLMVKLRGNQEASCSTRGVSEALRSSLLEDWETLGWLLAVIGPSQSRARRSQPIKFKLLLVSGSLWIVVLGDTWADQMANAMACLWLAMVTVSRS